MNWGIVWEYRAALWHGLLLTLQISFWSILGSFLLGTVIGCLATLPSFIVRRFVAAYVEILRNIPSVVKLFFLYFVVGLDAMPAAIIGLVTHQSAYIADMIASGFRAVPREQFEAAYACGHTRPQIFRWVMLPQVFRIILPTLTTQFIEVLKNSAAAMLLGIEELTFQTQQIESQTFRGFEAATVVTGLYLALAMVIVGAMHAVERRLRTR